MVTQLGIDEQGFRSARWFEDETGGWRRVEPWMIPFVDLTTCAVLDVVDGRGGGAAVSRWSRSIARRRFRSAVRRWLPKAAVSVDHSHLVKLRTDVLTDDRRRVSWDLHGRRGRGTELTWAHRLLLLSGYDTVSTRGRARLDEVFAHDDPSQEIGAA